MRYTDAVLISENGLGHRLGTARDGERWVVVRQFPDGYASAIATLPLSVRDKSGAIRLTAAIVSDPELAFLRPTQGCALSPSERLAIHGVARWLIAPELRATVGDFTRCLACSRIGCDGAQCPKGRCGGLGCCACRRREILSLAIKRKGITLKKRFEILKRDGFRCRYCGRSAPDVILNVDHKTPVAAKGGNEDANLVTACFDCNAGKSDRLLNQEPNQQQE
jgi:hypothetical protein